MQGWDLVASPLSGRRRVMNCGRIEHDGGWVTEAGQISAFSMLVVVEVIVFSDL